MSKTKKPPNLTKARRGSRTNLVLTVAVIAIAAAILGGVLLVNRQSSADNAAQLSGEGHSLSSAGEGAPDLVEFIDFQCEACNAYYNNITSRLLNDYKDRINFTIRLFPLPNHPLGLPAAKAAEAAALQGRFADFYTRLFQEYDTWAGHSEGGSSSEELVRGRTYFIDVASQIGLDVTRFTADMDSDEVAATIQDSIEAGQQLGVTSTPTFFLDGAKFGDSANSYAEFDQQLRTALDQGIG